MDPHPDSPGDSGNETDTSEIPENAGNSFTRPETNHALDFLLKDPSQYLSGNGFKTKACTDISVSLKKKFPGRPIRSKDVVGNRLRYVKHAFEDYEFVRGKSGVGWDDELKMATAEADFIKKFIEEHGDKYLKCFKKPCPYYNRLAQLFGGNKATGAHILHLTKPKKSKASAASGTGSGSSSTSASKRKRTCQPLENLDNENIDIDSGTADTVPKPPPSPKPYDDELLPAPPKRSRLSDTTIDLDDDSDNENEQPKKKKASARDRDHDRSTSAGSSSGGRRASRNAEMGNQIARGLKMIGEGMSAPLITKADTSHVDAIVEAFIADPTLLPADPEGEYYALFLDALSSNEMRARVFIKTQNRIQRIALIKRVLTEKEIDVPLNWV
ncbi:hypothetical protein B0H19DRAFT_382955 [Mycena capillaripes]|nr:hypothetical protein B0H19DRAFT_382955 [Mycena capillaripes]